VDNGKIKAVIFDLGNVLVDFDHRIAAKRISKFSDKAPEDIFNLFFDSNLTELFEEGKISPQDFFAGVKETLNSPLKYEEFLPIWNEIFFLSEKNRAVYNLAKSLDKSYKLAMLSNINILHHQYLRDRFPMFDIFPHIITSYEVGARKPKGQIYKKAIELLGAAPEEVFYTDDRPELVDSAKALGINGFVFRSADQLKKDLGSAGVTIN